MSKFGWRLPPGCGTLPGEEPEQIDNQYFATAFPDYSGPADLYRSVYKYTDCGPSVGFQILYIQEPTGEADAGPLAEGEQEVCRWFYCDDLWQWGTWADMDAAGALIVAVSVSSIVEGTDAEIPPQELDVNQLDEESADFAKRFYEAVDEVDQEAKYIWSQTHGCEDCGIEGEWGDTAINPDCKTCGGEGTIL